MRARAIENQIHLVACDVAGSQAGHEMAGASVVVDPWGVVLAEAGRAPGSVTVTLTRVADSGTPARLSCSAESPADVPAFHLDEITVHDAVRTEQVAGPPPARHPLPR
ncbi:nitrilase-related carbon-nitrogen hydrolase [Pseudofrankia asymbiotica]|uniref:CN hydrolase domain-containing protein n=1 Tax=Pseudofrankia asymbiotica TaxID=1834516 RepID=A0A1V2IEZ4_9ACTN|nr:nitrilase-related carbon-nitrogen hydrolase [Pseudofrankia asymbiotica]ONH31635.1 hypothetical protein BL253_08155 [Pseudofrankia asymbiotica]